MRFDEKNVYKQCSMCNNYKSGNLVNYRKNLIAKIGLEAVEKLESAKSLKTWSVEELKDIIKTYSQKLKDLNNG